MCFITSYRKKKTEDSIKRAVALQEEAAALTNEKLSCTLYCQAYEIYRKISKNILLGNEIRGEAGYSMYLLAKENKVALSPIISNGMTLETSEVRLKNLLFWSVNLGCDAAISELTGIQPRTFNSLSLPSYPNTPKSRQSLSKQSL